jgi:peroxiredoxin family protein
MGEDRVTKLAMISSKGTLDWAYPPFILASTAAALGFDVKIFFTFYGLKLLEKDLDLQVTSLGNPAMPMPFPVPVFMQAMPGMQAVMTEMMKKKISSKNVASIEELRDLSLEAGVTLIGCQMTMDLFEFKREQLLDDIEIGGAATFLEFAAGAEMSLFI